MMRIARWILFTLLFFFLLFGVVLGMIVQNVTT